MKKVRTRYREKIIVTFYRHHGQTSQAKVLRCCAHPQAMIVDYILMSAEKYLLSYPSLSPTDPGPPLESHSGFLTPEFSESKFLDIFVLLLVNPTAENSALVSMPTLQILHQIKY